MEHITTPAGITYSYEKSGSGPPLILVHGTLTTHMTAWMVVKPLFEPRFTTYAVARRGRGETTATEGHTIPDEAADLAALIDSIGEPVFLLGHSYGAHVALAATPIRPGRVRRLVLYEPPLTNISDDTFARLEQFGINKDYDAVVFEFMRDVIQMPGQELEMLKNSPFWPFLVADAQASLREWPVLMNYAFDAANFKSLDVPVLLLTGSESPQENYATDALAAALPKARVEIFAGQGHGANFAAPQEFAEVVTNFFTED
jgi:pimeloyl-ACP methyl ester carboxylesterase